MMTPDWQRWLLTNYARGLNLQQLRNVMLQNGLSAADIDGEINALKNHPYAAAAVEFAHLVKKRDWLLSVKSSLADLSERNHILKEADTAPPFVDFIRDHYSTNLPLLIRQGVAHWPATQKWTPQYLKQTFNDVDVEVQFNRSKDPQYERHVDQYRKTITMGAFVEMVENVQESNDFYLTANNHKNTNSGISPMFEDMADIGDGYLDLSKGNQGFLWFGPKGTITQMHHDLTNNIFIQVYGTKRVLLAPSHQVQWIYNDHHVYSKIDPLHPDLSAYPEYKNVSVMDFIMGPGDVLFIPIGWWHCIISQSISISLTLVNFNGLPNGYSDTYPRN